MLLVLLMAPGANPEPLAVELPVTFQAKPLYAFVRSGPPELTGLSARLPGAGDLILARLEVPPPAYAASFTVGAASAVVMQSANLTV